MGIWGLGEEVWHSLSVTQVDLKVFKISKEHFPCWYCKTNAGVADHGLLHSWLPCCFPFLSPTQAVGTSCPSLSLETDFMCCKPVEQLHAWGTLNENPRLQSCSIVMDNHQISKCLFAPWQSCSREMFSILAAFCNVCLTWCHILLFSLLFPKEGKVVADSVKGWVKYPL